MRHHFPKPVEFEENGHGSIAGAAVKVAALLLLAASLLVAQDPKPAAPKPAAEQKEITGAPALKVLVLHWRFVSAQQQAELLRAELSRLHAQAQAAIDAACIEQKVSPCVVKSVGEESITVEKKK